MNYNQVSTGFMDDLYPVVEERLSKNLNKFKAVISDFINSNSKNIFDIAPYDMIYHKRSDVVKLLASLQLTEADVDKLMQNCYYWKIPYRPKCAKEPYVLVCIAAIIYLLRNKKLKDAELVSVYLAFSGKIYASLFYQQFQVAPPSKYKEVMDYVVNNMLTNKHTLKTEGTVFGVIKVTVNTWMNTYLSKPNTKFEDEYIGKQLIDQLRSRVKSWLINISRLYYEAYENRNYLNSESDNLEDGNAFRLTDSDSLRASRDTDVALNYMVTQEVSLEICNIAKTNRVKPLEIKEIIHGILLDKGCLPELRMVINILICDFISKNPGKKTSSLEFVTYSLKAKPNTKDENVLKMKSTIIRWMSEKSENYIRRAKNPTTAIDYYKAVLGYIVFAIHKAIK